MAHTVTSRTLSGAPPQTGAPNAANRVRSRTSGIDVARRRLQTALAALWLVDAILQYQPSMFTPAFVTHVLEPAAAGTPAFVAVPAGWAAHILLRHVGLYDAGFATVQLGIAAGLLWSRSVRVALSASIAWSVGIWWLGEGLGGLTTGATALQGAPGAALLYALIAVLVWPPNSEQSATPGVSVAESGPAGTWAPKVVWVTLWAGLAAVGLEVANRAPNALTEAITSQTGGQPGWVRSVLDGLADLTAHHGLTWSIALAIAFCTVAVAVLAPSTRRVALLIAVVLAAGIWTAEGFGAIFTGNGTDPNTGPLLALLAATLWPRLPRRSLRPTTARQPRTGPELTVVRGGQVPAITRAPRRQEM